MATIQVGKIRNDKTREMYAVEIEPPDDEAAKRGRPPRIKVLIGIYRTMEPDLWDAIRHGAQVPELEPVIAESLGRMLVKAAEMAAEKWPAWGSRLIAEKKDASAR